MKQQSEYLKIHRYILESLLKDATEIAVRDKTKGIENSGDSYANALGRCNAQASGMASTLRYLLEVRS